MGFSLVSDDGAAPQSVPTRVMVRLVWFLDVAGVLSRAAAPGRDPPEGSVAAYKLASMEGRSLSAAECRVMAETFATLDRDALRGFFDEFGPAVSDGELDEALAVASALAPWLAARASGCRVC